MTDLEPKPPMADGEPDAINETETPKPPPEPLTPRKVSEWNAYYDVYVVAFVLLLSFIGSAYKIQGTNSAIWSMLQTGREIAANGAPVVVDRSSIASEGQRWVNIPWLFELLHYEVYANVQRALMPTPAPLDPGATPEAAAAAARAAAEEIARATPRAEQYGAGALIAMDALIRAITAFLLLGLRRKGPGLWWAAICVTMALGVTLSPEPVQTFEPVAGAAAGEVVQVIRPTLGAQIGGIVGTASLAPETWGLLFLTIELLLLHHAINLGKAGRIYGLIPLFLIWANFDESFAIGLIVLTACVLGLLFDRRREPVAPPSKKKPIGEIASQSGTGVTLKRAAIVLGVCFLVTFVNPSHVFGVLGAFGPILKGVGLTVGPPSPTPLSAFSEVFSKRWGGPFTQTYRFYDGALIVVGLLSFGLNRRHFAMSWLLMFLSVSWLMVVGLNFTIPFAAVLVAVLILNGQQWYQEVYGVEGKLGTGWSVWSTGGRLVTIVVVFFAIFRGATGWGGQVGGPQFGFGYNPDDFTFEAADALKNTSIEGNVLNTSAAQGDALAWRSLPDHKPFFDSRLRLYTPEQAEERRQLRVDLRDDNVAKWKPVLDRYKISAVMIQVSGDKEAEAPKTYARLMASPNWIPFHDDGAIVMFGRSDAGVSKSDLAYFQSHSLLDAEALVYQRPRLAPSWERPPTVTQEWLDSVFQNRLLNRPQPHSMAAEHWLNPVPGPEGPRFPDPAYCFLAIREARTALSIKPDDATAFLRLVDAYRLLLAEESALIAGVPLTSASSVEMMKVPQQTRLLANRTRQVLTSLNFALQTMAPPKTVADRRERASLNFTLAELYAQTGALDLARDRLLAITNLGLTPGEVPDAFFSQQARQLGELDRRIQPIQDKINQLVIENRVTPPQKADYARFNGAPGLAINELVEAEQAGGNAVAFRPALVDLYCETGQPDKALDVIALLNIDDPSLSSRPNDGTATYRQGLVYFLLGNYVNAASLWKDRSIPRVSTSRGMDATAAGLAMLRGEPKAATRIYGELPERLNVQAQWEFDLGLAALEGGLPPEIAIDHLSMALKLEPNLSVRPVIAYYLRKLGKPVTDIKVPFPRAVEPEPATDKPKPTEPAKP